MLLRGIFAFFLMVMTVFGQGGFNPLRHIVDTSQGTVRIMLRDLPAGANVNWILSARIGTTARAEIMEQRVSTSPQTQKLTFQFQSWENVLVATGLIEINALDTLKDGAIGIILEVPAHTRVSVERDSKVLFTAEVEGNLAVRNGVEMPVLVATR